MVFYKKLIKNLLDKNITVSVAESCTGGKLSQFFTDISGISKIFNMGLVTYSNESKINILKIPKSLIKQYGSVSNETAKKMAQNLFKISKSKLCISTTGIAGPSGGTKNKPVGLVFICIKFNKKILIFKKKFNGNRIKIQKETVNFCIKELEKLI